MLYGETVKQWFLLGVSMELKGKIVFSSGRSTDFDIWTLELPGGQLRQLTHGKDLNDTPRWSPDGSQIVFTSIGDDLISSLCVMDKDGKNKRRLTENVHAQHPSWSADGRNILFTANAGNRAEIEICLYDLHANNYKVLFRREGEETEPCLSPDGKKILFAGTDPRSEIPFPHRDTEIWEHDVESGVEQKLYSHPAQDYSPVYSPDGLQIAFISHRNGRSEEEYLQKLQEIKKALNPKDRLSIDRTIRALQDITQDGDIFVADRNGQNLKQLTQDNGLNAGVRWSPCGQYLVYSAAPKGDTSTERLKVIEVKTRQQIPFEYDRTLLQKEIDSDPKRYLNNRIFMHLVPDFIEARLLTREVGSMFWGEERRPDWTHAT